MSDLNDLKRQLIVIGIQAIDQKGNYRAAADIYKDIGVLYQKFYNAGVSALTMKLLDKVSYDIITEWDRLVENEKNKSCSYGTQTGKNQGSREGYRVLVGRTDQEFISLL